MKIDFIIHINLVSFPSIRFVMKKLFWSAATPFSGRMEVWRHTGQERVKLWAGM